MLGEAMIGEVSIADDYTITDLYVAPAGNPIVDAIDAVTAAMVALTALLVDLRGMLATR